MARPNQEAIETFIGITGASEAVAVQKLEERGGDLNEAVNAYFNEGDRSSTHGITAAPAAAPEDDVMDIDEPIQAAPREPPFSILPSARNLSPFSLLDPDLHRSLFDSGPDFTSRAPYVSHPRNVREIPIEVKDGGEQSSHAPTIEDVTGAALDHGPETRGTVIIDDDDDEDVLLAASRSTAGPEVVTDDVLGSDSRQLRPRPSAPVVDVLPDYNNDIEEEMIRAAIEASKRELENGYPDQQFGALHDLHTPGTQQGQSGPVDADLEQAVSMSLKTAEQEKALRELEENAGLSHLQAYKSMEVEDRGKRTSNGRLDVGSSSLQDEADDVEEQPLVRNRSRHMSSTSIDAADEIGGAEETLPSIPGQPTSVNHPQQSTDDLHNDEWGGMSSLEHDEAVMLEAALFGGIPEGRGYQFPYAPHQLMQNGLDRTSDLYSQRMPRPPSPNLVTQRLLREQQDDEYLASLQADREKAEARRLEEAAAREAALEEERKKEEESRKKLEEEQEIERQLAAKEASLPQEPATDDENAVNLLVRMPDGSRRGRRFVKTDRLKSLFDFIDIGRLVKPGTYRLVRPYPRRAFSDGESALTLNELGLTSKQEALFLETI